MKLLALGGWLVAVFLWTRYRRLQRVALEALMTATDTEMAFRDAHRVKLSCPLCLWTDAVIRETREAAIEAGSERIADHNRAVGHAIGGTPRTGYFRGEPLN